jgi:hypothetical protein
MLTATQLAQLGHFDAASIAALGDAVGTTETVSATAATLSAAALVTFLTVSGTMTGTLADGTVAGQRKIIICDSAAASPAYTLTITTPESAAGHVCASTWIFDTAGQGIELLWTGTKWRAIRVRRAGGVADAIVVGTTLTAGRNLWAQYLLSVTGTVSSTIAGARGIPDGSSPGEVISVGCSTAAAIPAGTIQMTGRLPGSATNGARTLATFGATTNYMNFMWDGSGWLKLAEGVTVTYA